MNDERMMNKNKLTEGMLSGADPEFSWGGGGEGKRWCARMHDYEREGQSPLRPGS